MSDEGRKTQQRVARDSKRLQRLKRNGEKAIAINAGAESKQDVSDKGINRTAKARLLAKKKSELLAGRAGTDAMTPLNENEQKELDYYGSKLITRNYKSVKVRIISLSCCCYCYIYIQALLLL
jgi:hypothetical protein